MSGEIRLRTFSIVCGLLCLLASACNGESATVYFVPFAVQTYVPVTQANIQSVAWEKWTLTEKSQIDRLIGMLNGGGASQFDDRAVRCLVIYGDKRYFIDSSGVVADEDASRKVDATAIVSFRKSLSPTQVQSLRKPGAK